MVTDGAPEAVLRPVRVLQTGLDSQAVGANLSPLPVELGLECDRQDAVLYSEWPCRAQQGAQDGLAGLDVVDDIGPAGLQRVGERAPPARPWRARTVRRLGAVVPRARQLAVVQQQRRSGQRSSRRRTR